MKKKFLTLLLAVCAVIACAFGLSACGGSGGDDSPTVHSHKWSQEWDKDATHHWHNCTADGCDVTKNSEKDGYAVHDFTNGNCICGEKDPSAPTEGLKYTLNKDGESYSCTGKGTATDYEIVIASEYEGKPVTCIGTEAFYECIGLTSITIPDSVTSIGVNAFYECIGLTSITIPDSVTSIGYGAFSGCSRLTSVIIPDSVTSIGGSEFSGCSSLESITVASGNTKYHSSGNCLIETASKTLIAGCKNSVIPDDGSVTSIGVKAFLNCRGLTSITIGNSVTSIEGMAFSDCSSLESITVASENTKYHSSGNCLIETASKTLIAGCKNSVIPDDGSVTSIGEGAFIGCSGLTSITISDSVTSIGDKAFFNCLKLTSVIIPDSVTSIGSCAFEYCNMLTIYCEAESKPSGWDSSWNGTYSPVPVVWGYKG